MTRMTKCVLVVLAGVAIGLFSAKAAWSQSRLEAPPRSDLQPRPDAPSHDDAVDESANPDDPADESAQADDSADESAQADDSADEADESADADDSADESAEADDSADATDESADADDSADESAQADDSGDEADESADADDSADGDEDVAPEPPRLDLLGDHAGGMPKPAMPGAAVPGPAMRGGPGVPHGGAGGMSAAPGMGMPGAPMGMPGAPMGMPPGGGVHVQAGGPGASGPGDPPMPPPGMMDVGGNPGPGAPGFGGGRVMGAPADHGNALWIGHGGGNATMGLVGTLRIADSEMAKLMREDMELEQQSHQLAAKCRAASDEERTKIKKQIVELVSKQFDVRQQRRTLELKRMEEELKRLRDLLDRRAKAQKDLIKKHVVELLGPEEPDVQF